MKKNFLVKSLGKKELHLALPLIQAIFRNVTPEQWQVYAETSNVLCLQDHHGYIQGIFIYRVDQDLTQGRVLTLENILAAHLFCEQELLGALVEGAETLARNLNCSTIHVVASDPMSSRGALAKNLINALRQKDFHIDGMRYCLQLNATLTRRASTPIEKG